MGCGFVTQSVLIEDGVDLVVDICVDTAELADQNVTVV